MEIKILSNDALTKSKVVFKEHKRLGKKGLHIQSCRHNASHIGFSF